MNIRLLVALLLGVFMGALDNSILAPALPEIAASLNSDPAKVILVFSIYAVFYAVSVPLLGKLSDLFGYKRIYTFAMGLFILGSMLSALAPNLTFLVFARVVQGIGAGGLFPIAQAVIGSTYPEEQQGKALGFVFGVYALGSIIGPNLGGFIVENFSWSMIFWVNIPIGLIGMALLIGTQIPQPKRVPIIDWVGGILVIFTFASLILGIQGIQYFDKVGFWSVEIGLRFALFVVGGVLLVIWERKHRDPIVDVRLVATQTFMPILIVSNMVGYALLGGIVFGPLYSQLAFNLSAFSSGVILNALAITLALTSAISGLMINRLGGKKVTIIGMAFTAAGLGIMAYTSSTLLWLLTGLAILGFGLGFVQGPLSFLALATAREGTKGQVSSLISLTRSIGAAGGITISGVLLGRAGSQLSQTGEGSSNLHSFDLSALQQAPPFVQDLIIETLKGGIIAGWKVAFFAAAIGLAASVFLKDAAISKNYKTR